MADGIRCKHCGWQEGSHELSNVPEETDPEEANQRLPYRRKTLIQCVGSTGFEAPKSSQRKSRRQEQFEEAYLDRRARGMIAWGAYGAYCRQVQFDEQLDKIKDSEVRKAFIAKGVAANHVLHIGPY